MLGVGIGLEKALNEIKDLAGQKKERDSSYDTYTVSKLQSQQTGESRRVQKRKNIEFATQAINEYGFNFLNNWNITYGKNNSIADERNLELMSIYTSEISLPNFVIEVSNIQTMHSNEDVNNVEAKQFSVTIWLDENLHIYHALLDVLNTMKNFKTARFGYRDNYKFDTISVEIWDKINNDVLIYTFNNCIIKGGTFDMLLNKDKSELKTISIVFGFIDFEVS
jgi:hypothetical protein